MADKKKRHRVKKTEPLARIEGDFDIVGCDLSMRCPGFALIHYDAATRTASLLRKSCVKNRANNKPHGRMLSEIADEFISYTPFLTTKVFVRERAFARFNTETIVLNKVVGVTDLTLWDRRRDSFQELAPSEIKKLVTGWYRAGKNDVIEAMTNYIGEVRYETDDESDACACIIAWLIRNGYMDTIPLPKYESTYMTTTGKVS